jgi:hypothetical protein
MFKNGGRAHQIQQHGHSPCPSPQPLCQCYRTRHLPLPHSRNTSLQGWPQSTGTPLYNCGTNFCTKLRSRSIFCPSHPVIPENLTMSRSTVLMILTKHQSCQFELKTLSTTTLPSAPAGRHTKLMHFTLALSPRTISVCNFACQPPDDVALWTHGNFT